MRFEKSNKLYYAKARRTREKTVCFSFPFFTLSHKIACCLFKRYQEITRDNDGVYDDKEKTRRCEGTSSWSGSVLYCDGIGMRAPNHELY